MLAQEVILSFQRKSIHIVTVKQQSTCSAVGPLYYIQWNILLHCSLQSSDAVLSHVLLRYSFLLFHVSKHN